MLTKKRKSNVAGRIVKKYLSRKKEDADFLRLAEILIPSLKKGEIFKDGFFISYVRPSSSGRIKVGKLVKAMQGNTPVTQGQCLDIVKKGRVQHSKRGYIRISRIEANLGRLRRYELIPMQ